MAQPVKKYVCVISVMPSSGRKKRDYRSIPMPLEAATNEMGNYQHDGIDARVEEANEDDLAPLIVAKQRAKERKTRKKEIEARRLVP